MDLSIPRVKNIMPRRITGVKKIMLMPITMVKNIMPRLANYSDFAIMVKKSKAIILIFKVKILLHSHYLCQLTYSY